jgi:hypothetical protein
MLYNYLFTSLPDGILYVGRLQFIEHLRCDSLSRYVGTPFIVLFFTQQPTPVVLILYSLNSPLQGGEVS